MPTTITVEPEVKEELDQIRPETLTWGQFLHALGRSVDPERLEREFQSFYAAEYQEAARLAKERYEAAQRDPDSLLSATEARKRVRALRGRK
ncbi:MAG: hypothetical protein HY556_09835 [Euryarchaeota archaeon]|nr:hypothetical protein [Euryarchaeota archaeon]